MAKYYDFHIHSVYSEGESSIEQLASMAKDLGYSGICIIEFFKSDKQVYDLYEKIRNAKEKFKIEILLGLEARSMKELMTLKNKRRKFDILLVRGGDIGLNRKACETVEVDILAHPEFMRMDSGMNHVMMKLAARNKVAIEINHREVLLSSKKTRSKIIGSMRNNIRLARKFKVPIIVCSGAASHWELRDPFSLVSFANQLGLEMKDAKEALSKTPENIMRRIKERKDDKWIMPGVRRR